MSFILLVPLTQRYFSNVAGYQKQHYTCLQSTFSVTGAHDDPNCLRNFLTMCCKCLVDEVSTERLIQIRAIIQMCVKKPTQAHCTIFSFFVYYLNTLCSTESLDCKLFEASLIPCVSTVCIRATIYIRIQNPAAHYLQSQDQGGEGKFCWLPKTSFWDVGFRAGRRMYPLKMGWEQNGWILLQRKQYSFAEPTFAGPTFLLFLDSFFKNVMAISMAPPFSSEVVFQCS